MKQRSDMAYLTLLSFSLSMVLAMQQGHTAEEATGLKSAKLRGQQICLLNAHDIREAFRVLAAQDASFVFEHNQLTSCSITDAFEDALNAMYCCPVVRIAAPQSELRDQEVQERLSCSAKGFGLGLEHAPVVSLHVPFSHHNAGSTHSAHWSSAPTRAGPVTLC